MRIIYNISGPRRKELANALGDILGKSVTYTRAPRFAYETGGYTVDKNSNIECPQEASTENVLAIVERLKRSGFVPEEVVGDEATVILPREGYTEEAIVRLKQITENKAELFKRAFQTEDVPIGVDEKQISFPWFTLHCMDGEMDAYTQFVSALGRMAKNRHRVLARPYSGTNDKFYMRLFLVQLGLKGPKYRETRRILLRRLSGNSAWKSGHAPGEGGTE